MSENPAIKLVRAYENLAVGKDLCEAIYMACGSMEDDRSKTAIQAVSDCLKDVISQVLDAIEEVREDLK
ncbi:hypothetical protein [Rhizobium sp. 21-4511-3d]